MGASASKHKTHGSKRDINRVPVRPSPPGKPHLVPGAPYTEPDVVTITWDPPENDGGARVTGYLVEHRRTGSPHWVRASPHLVRVTELTLSGLEPGWRYQFRVSARNALGMSEPGELSELLTVTLQRTAASAPHFIKELTDIVALENEKAELTVELRGTPVPTVAWYKDGLEIFSGRRHRIVTENGTSTLIIHQTALSDEGEIKCAATNRVGHAVTKATIRMEAPPSIRLPRQYEDGLLFEKDEVMRLKVTIAGKPEPSISWLHNGEPILNSGRYEMIFTDRHSTLRIDEARRSDRGEYQVKAVNILGEDIASFLVTVTDRPLSPGKAKVVMTLGRSVTLSWTSPEDDGGCKIGNYIVEYYRLGWNMWLKAATCRQLTTNLGDLIEGSEYKFRVKAENPYGVSDPGEESDILFIPDPHRGLLSPPDRHEGSRGVEDVGIEEWLLEPHKRQRDGTPEGSPSQEPKKVKRKPERANTPETFSNPEKMLISEDTGYFPKSQKPTENKGQQDTPKVPKRRAKRKQEMATGNIDDEEKLPKTLKGEGKTEEKILKKEKSEDIHGSSELMLVLVPQSRATTEERESTRKEIIDSLKSGTPGVAPPMSLSAPELGTIEPQMPLQRSWVSSTELLHERAMARLYQAVAEEEQQKVLNRRYSVERRSSFRSQERLQQFAQRQKSFEEDYEISEKKNRKSKDTRLELNLAPDLSLSRQNQLPDFNQSDPDISKLQEYKKKGFHQQYSEEGEEEEEYIEEDVGSAPEDLEEAYEESDVEDEEYSEEIEEEEEVDEEALDDNDYEMEEVEEEEEEYEEELEEEEEDLDETDILGGSEIGYNERPPYTMEEDTYHPRNMTPRSGTFTPLPSTSPSSSASTTSPSRQRKRITDDLQNVTKVVTAVVSHSIKIPVKATLKPPEIVHPTVRIEVTPPPDEDNNYGDQQLAKHVIKPIIKNVTPARDALPPAKYQSSTKHDDDQSRKSPSPSKQYLPPQFTPDGRYLPNPNPVIPKPILKIREHSQERTVETNKSNNKTSAPLAAVEPELNLSTQSDKVLEVNKSYENINATDSAKLKKKQVRIEVPVNDKKSIEIDDDIDLTLAGDVARNRRRSRSNSLLEAAADPTKCLIHHYSDIVKEFGRVRKVPTTLYLNYEDLKAAAQKSELGFNPVLQSNDNDQETSNEDTTTEDIVMKSSDNNEEEEEDPLWSSKEDKKYEFLMESPEMQQLPKLIFLSDLQSKPKVEEKVIIQKRKSIDKAVIETKYDKRPVKEVSIEFKEEENKEICNIETALIIKKDGSNDVAARKVRSLLDYMTDLAMFVIACYLYAFSDERLAIPILLLMIYRQAKNSTVSFVKRTIAKLPKLPRLPWRKTHDT